jgi:KDO2-lipid IV(A) lauroyltransferase
VTGVYLAAVSHESSTIRRQLSWRAQTWAYDAVAFLVRLLPVEAASALGGAIVSVLGPRTSKHRIVTRNLELAFPDKSPAERAAIAREFWTKIGRTFGEFPIMDRITPSSGRVRVVGLERLKALAGTPAVLFSGHLSNWETMMAVIVHSELDCRVSYRPANNPYMDQRIIESRRRYGVQLFAARGSDGTRGLISALSKGGAVALLNDQRDSSGIEAPFFGRLVRSAPGPARLALKYGHRLVPMSVVRDKGARFTVTIHEPIELKQTGDRQADLDAAVAEVAAFIERCVRARPAEWFWAHRRWPLELYREPLATAASPESSASP